MLGLDMLRVQEVLAVVGQVGMGVEQAANIQPIIPVSLKHTERKLYVCAVCTV